jgi:hypothetical protein
MFPVAPEEVMPTVEPMPSVPPELSVNVPVPVSATLPLMFKVAPLETVQFFAAASAMAKPPLLKVPLSTLIFPVTRVAVIVVLGVAPLALVLLIVRLL